MARWQTHLIVGFLCAILFSFLLNIKFSFLFIFLLLVLAGSLLPDLDEFLKLGHRNPLLHSFIIPSLGALLFKGNILITGLSVGWTAHMITDLGHREQEWVIVNRKIGNALLVFSGIIIILLILML